MQGLKRATVSNYTHTGHPEFATSGSCRFWATSNSRANSSNCYFHQHCHIQHLQGECTHIYTVYIYIAVSMKLMESNKSSKCHHVFRHPRRHERSLGRNYSNEKWMDWNGIFVRKKSNRCNNMFSIHSFPDAIEEFFFSQVFPLLLLVLSSRHSSSTPHLHTPTLSTHCQINIQTRTNTPPHTTHI